MGAGADSVTAEARVFSVSEVQREVRELVEEFSSPSIWVEGEISNWRPYASGHRYFLLKDHHAQIDVVMWRSSAQRLRFDAEDGMVVRARGHLTLYEPRGKYQMIAQRLVAVGEGPLQRRFELLRAQLQEEGLFDPVHKKPLPAYPRRVALVTSPTGAAVRDLIHVVTRRWPALRLVVVPARVQGDGAADEVAAALHVADGLGVDVIITGRGGGSLEDLWAFNEEPVARAIFAAHTPVVSAVGHEVDTTIADLVADVRAATPSAAAELVAPNGAEVASRLRGLTGRLGRAAHAIVTEGRRRIDTLRRSRAFRRPQEAVAERDQVIDGLAERLAQSLTETLASRRRTLEKAAARLEALSPLKVLARGYCVTLKDDAVLRSRNDVADGDRLRTVLGDGEIDSIAVVE